MKKKTTFCLSENASAKLIGAFVFATRIVQLFLILNPNSQLLVIFCACTAQFVPDLFGNHIVGFLKIRLIYKYDIK